MEFLDSKMENELIKLSKKLEIDLLILFGSRAKNTNNESSDWDLAIYSKNEIKENLKIKFFNELREIFKEKKFDLIILDEKSSPILENQIFRFGKCIYESKKNLFFEKKQNSYFDYQDYKELLAPTKNKYLEI